MMEKHNGCQTILTGGFEIKSKIIYRFVYIDYRFDSLMG